MQLNEASECVSCFHGHPSAYRHLDWFHFLAVVSRASVNMEAGGSVAGFALLCYILRTSSTAGSHVSGGAGFCATVTLISIDSVSVCSHQLWVFFPHVFSSTCCHWRFVYCVFVCSFSVLVSTCALMHGMVGMWSSVPSCMHVRDQAWVGSFCSKFFTSWGLLLTNGFWGLKIYAQSIYQASVWSVAAKTFSILKWSLCWRFLFTTQKPLTFMDSHFSVFGSLVRCWSPSQKVLACAYILKCFL